jgi:hypothetical protein
MTDRRTAASFLGELRVLVVAGVGTGVIVVARRNQTGPINQGAVG